MAQNNDITAEELKELIDSNTAIVLIDVREEYEFDEDNLEGKLIPLGELPDRIDELEEFKDQDIYIHCRSGARSARAKQFLEQSGYENVHNVLGGILAYRDL